MNVKEAVEYVTHAADSKPANDVTLYVGETLNQCPNCGRRIITKADEIPPRVCGCDCKDPDWIAVRGAES